MADRGTKFDVTVEKLVYGGDGLSRREGQVVFTPFVLPGERVRMQAVRERPGLVWAQPLEVLDASPARIQAPCPYFGRCGGCHYQQAPYAYQLEIKRAILAEELRRIAKIEPPSEIALVAGEAWHYRNRAQFHLEGGEIGYREAGSHRLCPVARCPISSPAVNATLARLWEMLRDRRWPRFLRSLEVFTNERDVQLNVRESERPVARRFFDWCAERIPGWLSGPLDYPLGGTLYRVSSGSFFQVNRYLAEKLVEVALNGAAGGRALDLYAGVGLFSIPLALRFDHVTAVESGASAARDLRFNAARAAARVSVEQAAAADYLRALREPPDFVLLDPPRAGVGKPVVQSLVERKPPVLTIVSCDPATLARDLAGLLAGGYELEKLTLVDLFPQTYHIEAVARLRAQGAACSHLLP